MFLLTNLNNQHFQNKSTAPARAQVDGIPAQKKILFSTMKKGTKLTKSQFPVCPGLSSPKPILPKLPNQCLCLQHHPPKQSNEWWNCSGGSAKQSFRHNVKHRFQTPAMNILQHFIICTGHTARRAPPPDAIHWGSYLPFQTTKSSLLLVTTSLLNSEPVSHRRSSVTKTLL